MVNSEFWGQSVILPLVEIQKNDEDLWTETDIYWGKF